jgi:tetratricopeptide (TPR) repeat protein
VPKGFGNIAKPIYLTLCAIAKNEASRLAQCLESIVDFVDEIILVDTGSTDNTIAIAKKFGAKVFKFAWCDDFSAARNFALQQAQGEWILVLDADEILVESIKLALTQLMQRQDCLAVNLTRLEVGAQQSPYSLVSRLFRRHQDITFTGCYHEAIDQSVQAILVRSSQWQILTVSEVAIHHYGYQAKAIASKQKHEFAQRLMQKHLNLYPQDVYMHSKLGALYVETGNQQEGLRLLETGLELAQAYGCDRHTLFELYYHLAIAKSYIPDYQTARTYYQSALALDVPNIIKLPAYNNLGNILLDQVDLKEAIATYQKVIAIAPDFAKAHYNLGIALKASGQLRQAVSAYEQAIAIAPDYAEAYQNLGVVLMRLGQTQPAIVAFQQAIEHHEQQQNFAIAQAIRDAVEDLGINQDLRLV